jgi:hypothetical protein
MVEVSWNGTYSGSLFWKSRSGILKNDPKIYDPIL